MAHELDIITGTNDHAMISVIETPWHKLGKVLEFSPGLDDALRLAGLDWEVKKVAHSAHVPSTLDCDACTGQWGTMGLGGTCPKCSGTRRMPATKLVESKDSFSVVRMDRTEVIGTVGPVWQPLQNEQAFGVLRPLLDSGLATIETAGSLRRGKQVWMMVKFDQAEIIRRIAEMDVHAAQLAYEVLDEVLPYGLFTNDHSGGAKARIKETAIRVVCANTFGMAMGKDEDGTSVEVSHSGNVVQNYTSAANLMLQGVAKRWASLANARKLMMDTRLPEPTFNRLVLDVAVPIRHLELKVQRRDTTNRTKAALEKAHARRDGIALRWQAGIEHSGDDSAWFAYQALVEWADHDGLAIPGVMQDTRASAERRARSLYQGTLGTLKSRVARNLLNYSAGEEEIEEAEIVG